MAQLRSERMSQADRENAKGQLQTLETKIQRHFDFTKRQPEEAEKRKQELQQKKPEDEEDGGAQRTLVIKEIEEQSRLLEAD
jgi:C4-type Zn-finger protein